MLGGFVIAAEQIVLPSDGEGPDAVLNHVVVYLVAPVGDVKRQLLQDLVCIRDGFFHQRLRRALEQVHLHPGLELPDLGIGLLLAEGLPALMVRPLVRLVQRIGFTLHVIELPDVEEGLVRKLLILLARLEELASGMRPTAQKQFPFHPLEVLIYAVAVALDGSLEVFQQSHRHAGAPGAVLIEEEPVFRHHVQDAPYVSLNGTVLLVVDHRQRALVHLYIIAGQDMVPEQVVYRFELPDYCLEPVVDGGGTDCDAELLV